MRIYWWKTGLCVKALEVLYFLGGIWGELRVNVWVKNGNPQVMSCAFLYVCACGRLEETGQARTGAAAVCTDSNYTHSFSLLFFHTFKYLKSNNLTDWWGVENSFFISIYNSICPPHFLKFYFGVSHRWIFNHFLS